MPALPELDDISSQVGLSEVLRCIDPNESSQADRHISSDPPTPAELEALAQDIRALLEQAVPAEFRTHPGRALGVAGTPTSLAAIAQDLEPDRGPVLVTVQYHVAPERAQDFAAAMPALRRIRLRDGASDWGLFRDASAGERYVEVFLVNSWIEHLRQHERATVADLDVSLRVRAFHLGDEPPVVRHLIAERVPRQPP